MLNVAGRMSVAEKYVFRHLRHSLFPKEVAMTGNQSYFYLIRFFFFFSNSHKTMSVVTLLQCKYENADESDEVHIK
jgi:hypothetical protein